jgi:diguanylate cyclase (GGDEF)-like protein
LLFKKTVLLNIALAVICASLTLILSSRGILKRAELSSLDFYFHLRGPIQFNPRINIIEITDSDLAKIGRWPWPRSWHAAITKALTNLGAKSVYFDIIFSEPSTNEDDAIFEEAIKSNKNVYLPFVFQNNIIAKENMALPINRLFSFIKGTGAVNIYPDIDGTLRRIPVVFEDKQGQIYPHAALKIAMDYEELSIEGKTKRTVILSNGKKKVNLPISENNTMLINWAGKWENTFKHYGFLDILAGYQDILEKKKSEINPKDFENSICLIGLTATGLYDIKPIPLQPEYPGIGIIANTINSILNKNYLFDVPAWINFLLICLLSLLPAFFIFGEKPLREGINILLIGLLYFLLNFIFFKNNVRIGLFSPLFGIALSSLSIGVYNFVKVSIERQSFFKMSVTDGLTGLYNIRYFKILLETELTMVKIDREKKFAIIMSDVDHFKNFNDTYGHQVGDLVLKEVATVIKNSVRSSDIVARYGGEEIIVLLRGSSSIEDAGDIAEKIRKNIENTSVRERENNHKVTVSLGVSFVKPADTVDSIIKRADDGLYRSKILGRNSVSVMKEDLKSVPGEQH